MLGDHRSVSIDSRSSVIGCVEKSQVVGRVFLRIWPLNALRYSDLCLRSGRMRPASEAMLCA